jgi:hypothetical protein
MAHMSDTPGELRRAPAHAQTACLSRLGPQSVAELYFPRLEQPSGITITVSDLEGRNYSFRWRFWVNNASRMYLLEGAGELHRKYGLESGDLMVFGQRGDGSLVMAGRPSERAVRHAQGRRVRLGTAWRGGALPLRI